MVKKLIKYDFMSYFRLLFPVQIIIIGIAVVNRLIQLFEARNSSAYDAVFISSVVLLTIACMVSLVMTVILSVVRFYQGMYSSEGYLSHTLPVTPSQHIISKLLVSLIFLLGTFCVIVLSVCISTFGDVNIELFKAFGFLLNKGYQEWGFHLILFILEILLIVLFYIFSLLLMFYFCLSVGQLVPRKKILLAFGVLFGLYTLGQILTTAFIIVAAANPRWIEAFSDLLNQLWQKHPLLSVHLTLLITAVSALIQSAVFFLITRYIMKRKLNLV